MNITLKDSKGNKIPHRPTYNVDSIGRPLIEETIEDYFSTKQNYFGVDVKEDLKKTLFKHYCDYMSVDDLERNFKDDGWLSIKGSLIESLEDLDAKLTIDLERKIIKWNEKYKPVSNFKVGDIIKLQTGRRSEEGVITGLSSAPASFLAIPVDPSYKKKHPRTSFIVPYEKVEQY